MITGGMMLKDIIEYYDLDDEWFKEISELISDNVIL